MVPVPAGMRVSLATGHTDMRKILASLACAGRMSVAVGPSTAAAS
jgi:hypothetical protein